MRTLNEIRDELAKEWLERCIFVEGTAVHYRTGEDRAKFRLTVFGEHTTERIVFAEDGQDIDALIALARAAVRNDDPEVALVAEAGRETGK